MYNLPLDSQKDVIPREDRPIRGRPAGAIDSAGRAVYACLYGNYYVFRGGGEWEELFGQTRGLTFDEHDEKPWLNPNGMFTSVTRCWEVFRARADLTQTIIQPSDEAFNEARVQCPPTLDPYRCQELAQYLSSTQDADTPSRSSARAMFPGQLDVQNHPMEVDQAYQGDVNPRQDEKVEWALISRYGCNEQDFVDLQSIHAPSNSLCFLSSKLTR